MSLLLFRRTIHSYFIMKTARNLLLDCCLGVRRIPVSVRPAARASSDLTQKQWDSQGDRRLFACERPIPHHQLSTFDIPNLGPSTTIIMKNYEHHRFHRSVHRSILDFHLKTKIVVANRICERLKRFSQKWGHHLTLSHSLKSSACITYQVSRGFAYWIQFV